MYHNQELDPSPQPSPAGGFLHLLLGVFILLLSLVGLVAGFSTFLQAAPILVKMLIVIVLIAVPVVIIGSGLHCFE